MADPLVVESGRKYKAMAVVERHAAYVAGATLLLPVWWLTSPSIAGLQLKMLSEISGEYQVSFDQDLARPLLASLAGGGLSFLVSQAPLSLAFKAWVVAIPVIGVPLRLAMGPAIMAAYTYVLGSAFVDHYAAGGSYRDFRVAEFKDRLMQLSADVLS